MTPRELIKKYYEYIRRAEEASYTLGKNVYNYPQLFLYNTNIGVRS